ncbi:MAG: hypothetical protein NTY83_03685, partial [Candidatus Micrarchaeota archaeon]|nr:hypothetical protein [Candidatus Micrarchaeota archaeon]
NLCMKKRPEHEEQKPSEQSHQPKPGTQKARGRPRHPSSFSRIGGAALATALALSHAPSAEARQLPGKARAEQPKPAAPSDKPGHEHREAYSRVDTSTRYTRNGDESTFIIMYRDAEGRENGVPISLSPELGSPREVFAGAERTVVFTDKAILITQGYNSCFRGELFVPMEDAETRSSLVMVALPQDSAGDSLLAYTRASGETEDLAYVLGASGMVRSRQVSTMAGHFSEAQIEATRETRLVPAGEYAIAYTPGSTVAYVLRGTGNEAMLARRMELSEPASSTPSAIRAGGDVIVDFGGQRFAIMRSVQGAPYEFTVLAL